MKSNRVFEAFVVFHTYQEINEIQCFLFDENIVRDIQESKAVVATYVLDINREMKGRWIIDNKENITEIYGELYHKKWNNNILGVAKVITLLELITVLERRGKHIEHGKIEIGFDNRIQY